MPARLEYDNNAFMYFAVSMLVVFAVPLTISIIRTIWNVFVNPPEILDKARTTLEKQKVKEQHQKLAPMKRLLTRSFMVKSAIAFLLWTLVAVIYAQTGEGSQIAQFDPFEILGLEKPSKFESVEDVDQSVVKKAYRKKSKEWHPDLWVQASPEDRAEAERKFLLVSKSHQTLTDKEALANYVEFGNPDGRQSMAVSFGLPSFLLEKGNANLVLLVYLLGIVVVVPLLVVLYYSNSKKYSDKLILNDTTQLYAFLLADNFLQKHLPEVLALSAEFRELPARSSDREALSRLERELKSSGGMAEKPCQKVASRKFFIGWPGCYKANVLIHAHLNRLTSDEWLTPDLKQDLEGILQKCPMLMNAMQEIATVRGARLSMFVMEFQQMMVQAVWVKDSDLQQLPHFGPNEIRHCKSGKGAIKNIREFVKSTTHDRLGGRRKGTKDFSEEQVADLDAVLDVLPNIKLDAKIGVLNDDVGKDAIDWVENPASGDFVTVLCTLTRQNLKPQEGDNKLRRIDLEKEAEKSEKKKGDELEDPEKAPLDELGFVHAPYWPIDKKEEWYLICTMLNDNRVIGFQKVVSDNRVVNEKLTFASQGLPAGEHSFTVYLKSTCYVGLDQRLNLKIKLIPREEIAEFEYHPEDQELDNEPSLFEQLGMANDDEEDSDFEDDEPKAKTSKPAGGKKATESESGLRQRKNVKNDKEEQNYEVVEEDDEDEIVVDDHAHKD